MTYDSPKCRISRWLIWSLSLVGTQAFNELLYVRSFLFLSVLAGYNEGKVTVVVNMCVRSLQLTFFKPRLDYHRYRWVKYYFSLARHACIKIVLLKCYL